MISQQLNKRGLKGPTDIFSISLLLDCSFSQAETKKYARLDPVLHHLDCRLGAADKYMQNPIVSPLFGDWGGIGRVFISVANRELLYPHVKQVRNKVYNFVEHNCAVHVLWTHHIYERG